jgi:hypothetical protein
MMRFRAGAGAAGGEMSYLRAIAIATCILASATPAPADPITIVAPANAAEVEGNTDNAFPFNTGAFTETAIIRYQQIFGAPIFSAAHPTPILLMGISFRPDVTERTPFSTTFRNVEISVSTTRSGVDQLNPIFAENVGADAMVVHSGPLTLSSSYAGQASGPKEFDIHIPFTSPFLYDPAHGSLLLDVINLFPGRTTQFDAVDDPMDQTSRIWSFDNLSFGEGDTAGLVARFTAEPVDAAPVPEPGSLMLLLTGTGFIGRRVWLRRRAGESGNHGGYASRS